MHNGNHLIHETQAKAQLLRKPRNGTQVLSSVYFTRHQRSGSSTNRYYSYTFYTHIKYLMLIGQNMKLSPIPKIRGKCDFVEAPD